MCVCVGEEVMAQAIKNRDTLKGHKFVATQQIHILFVDLAGINDEMFNH